MKTNKQAKPSNPNFQASTFLWSFSRKWFFMLNLISSVPSFVATLSNVVDLYFCMDQEASIHWKWHAFYFIFMLIIKANVYIFLFLIHSNSFRTLHISFKWSFNSLIIWIQIKEGTQILFLRAPVHSQKNITFHLSLLCKNSSHQSSSINIVR